MAEFPHEETERFEARLRFERDVRIELRPEIQDFNDQDEVLDMA